MKDKLQLLRNQLKMGHRISFSEAMLLQRAIDILVNKAGNSPAQSDCCPAQNQGWIPVSEQMPGSQEWVIVFAKWANQQVLCWDDVQNRWTDFEDQSYYADMFSHWMPLPAAPQEARGDINALIPLVSRNEREVK
ncbi:DUF551 domain-containing protein [Klebsiella pneumoniae]|uniref:DUF551 domain-containing protein n=1 Tax=Klebsiella pneumoniae TaxID=573 RepID=UPI000E2BD6D0|nr:DUF551 domain-containing protein [Klebsiella pneumoniae]SYV77012.1 Eaa1 [Klebsiella pneumoniae]